jgi:branched-chain amino acid aminotransferase
MISEPVWVDGSLPGTIDPRDRGLTLGDGVFDTLVAFGRIPFAGARHLERLVGQTELIGIIVDASRVRAGWDAVLGAADAEHLILRTTVTRGRAARGLWPAERPEPTVIVSATPWSASLLGRPIRLITSTIRRNPTSPAARLKTLSYLDNVLAAREAAEAGADDALFLNPAGMAACTTIANLFAISGERLITPPLDDGAQPGIMRALVVAAAGAADLAPLERSLTVAELLAADGVFLTNSVRFLMPVVLLDGRTIRAHGDALAVLMEAISREVLRECGYDPRTS